MRPHLHHSSVGRNHGFTLVEVLVVIVIVIVLAAVTLTITQKARERAHSANCVSNLRQLGALATGNATEKGFYQPMLSQNTGSSGGLEHSGDSFPIETAAMPIIQCPKAKYTGLNKNGDPISSYGSNPMVMVSSKDGTPPLVRVSQISRPSQIYLLADCAQHGPPNARSLNFSARWYGQRTGAPSDSEKPLTTAEIPSNGFWDPDVATMPMRHQGTANLVFCDGHVETIHNISELKQKNFYWNY
jgi:prepilin-type processing-associated H-X9-DG protein/prepilin-type N-terminal cleavage/methylation domain-containing protein